MAVLGPRDFSTTDPETVKVWSKRLTVQSTAKLLFTRNDLGLSGREGEGKPFVYKDELSKGDGDRIRLTMLRSLQGMGVGGPPDVLKGRAEGQRSSTFDFTIDEIRWAVGLKGRMSQQRVRFDQMKQGERALSDWAAEKTEIFMFTQLCGWNVSGVNWYRSTGGRKIDGTNALETGHNTVNDPDDQHILRVGDRANDGALTSGDYLDLDVIDDAILQVQMMDYPILPFRWMDGSLVYLLVIHPTQEAQLRKVGTNWRQYCRDAITGGKFDNNALAKPSLLRYNDVIIASSKYVSPGVHSGAGVRHTRRSVLLGQDALAYGYGKAHGDLADRWHWTFEKDDHGAVLETGCYSICGAAAVRHNVEKDGTNTTRDFGKLIISSYAEDKDLWAA